MDFGDALANLGGITAATGAVRQGIVAFALLARPERRPAITVYATSRLGAFGLFYETMAGEVALASLSSDVEERAARSRVLLGVSKGLADAEERAAWVSRLKDAYELAAYALKYSSERGELPGSGEELKDRAEEARLRLRELYAALSDRTSAERRDLEVALRGLSG